MGDGLGTVLAASLLIGCGGGGSNQAPQAEIRVQALEQDGGYAVFAEQATTLDGSASRDPEGTPLRWHWEVAVRPAEAEPELTGQAQAQASFTADRAGSYLLYLEVSDGERRGEAAVRVESNTSYSHWYNFGSLSVALLEAGPDRCVEVGRAAQAAGQIPAHGVRLWDSAWTLDQAPAGSLATLSGRDGLTPSLTPDRPGRYRLLWRTEFDPESYDGGFRYFSSGDAMQVDATPVRQVGVGYAAPGGLEVALLALRRSGQIGAAQVYELDLRLRNPGAQALPDAPVRLHFDNGMVALPLGWQARSVGPGDAGVVTRTGRYLVPSGWQPLRWVYGDSVEAADAALLLTWCADLLSPGGG